MNKSIVAGAALLAGIAIAAPELGWSADDAPQAGQSPAGAQEMPGRGRGMMAGHGMMGGMHERGEMSSMHRFGRMREMMMHRMRHASAQQRCEERLARRAAMVAYAGAKLKLTAEQRPLWDKLNTTLQAAGDKQQQLCDALKASGERDHATMLDRLNQAEQRLSTRLDAMRQVRPALEQLYQALTPEQKAVLDQSRLHG
jgi:flagellar capping protein FliD